MPFFQLDHIAVTGVAAAVPKQVVQIDDFVSEFGREAIEKYKVMTGIQQFHKTKDDQTASDLGFAAAQKLLQAKGIPKGSIGLLLFVTQSPDYKRPATACVLHKRLGLSENCAAYDINLGCSGFVYAVQTAGSMMQCSDIETALVIVAETSTKVMWPKDKSVAMLFGDSGTAVLLQKAEESSVRGGLWSKGEGCFSIVIPGGGFRDPDASREPFVGTDGNEHMLYYQVMNGTDIMQFSISEVPRSIKSFLEYTGTEMVQYDQYFLHQANAFILKQLMRKFKLQQEKVPISLDRYGNTGGASIPLSICDRFGKEEHSEEQHIFAAGFGIGLSWGVLDFWLRPSDVFPIVETEEAFPEGILGKETF